MSNEPPPSRPCTSRPTMRCLSCSGLRGPQVGDALRDCRNNIILQGHLFRSHYVHRHSHTQVIITRWREPCWHSWWPGPPHRLLCRQGLIIFSSQTGRAPESLGRSMWQCDYAYSFPCYPRPASCWRLIPTGLGNVNYSLEVKKLIQLEDSVQGSEAQKYLSHAERTSRN